jgi:hypothetical protein
LEPVSQPARINSSTTGVSRTTWSIKNWSEYEASGIRSTAILFRFTLLIIARRLVFSSQRVTAMKMLRDSRKPNHGPAYIRQVRKGLIRIKHSMRQGSSRIMEKLHSSPIPNQNPAKSQ